MNKKLLRILFFSSCFILVITFFNIDAKSLNENTEEGIIFAVLSDIHISESDEGKGEKLDKALRIINKKVPSIDKYIFTGDYTNRGFDPEYKLFNKIYNDNISSKEKRMILMGNHDYWNELDVRSSKRRFRNEMKKELYYSEKIKGYTFISLSTENDFINGYYSEKSLNFAKKEIEKSIKEDKNKPIFIFTHHPPSGTIYGSELWGNNDLKQAFDKYEQVILFSGHSHFPLNDERGIYQENFTVVSSGAIGGVGLEDGKMEGKIPDDVIDTSQGLIVSVDKDNSVTVTRMDFLNNEEIKEPWIIDSGYNKADFKYVNRWGNNEEPYFMVYSTVHIKSRRDDKVDIIFTQGKDDDMVHSYKIEVYEKSTVDNSENYTLKKTQENFIFSKFYLGSKMPDKLDLTIDNVNKDKDYIVEIYAIDSFGKTSFTPLKCEIPKM